MVLLKLLHPKYWRPIKARFEAIHQTNAWQGRESVSGVGSDLGATESIRRELPLLFRELRIRSILDAPCGDFHWMKELDLAGIDYTGMDLVPAIIEAVQNEHSRTGVRFIVGDITTGPLPTVDLILCRDGLVHLSNRLGIRAIENFRKSKSKYLLATTFPEVDQNRDIPTGSWRPINLELPPFNLGKPQQLIEDSDQQPLHLPKGYLGLWALAGR